MQPITLLPYSPPNLPGTFKRVIVKPIPKEEQNTPEGLLIPSDIGRICEIGIALHVCDDSTIAPGDRVLYAKVDRKSEEHLDTISIDGVKCDVLYENEIWSVNDFPYNRIFVEPFSDLQMNEDGLILPDDVKGVTQKGRAFRSPADYAIKAGDHIEYRKQEREIYPTVDIDGSRYEVLFESDVFTVNGKVAPYRIIVKIDISAQRIKRNSTESGLLRSQLFLYMLYNMQVGEVLEIGEEAQKNYPELRVGDSAIIHHTIEAQSYRLIKKEFGKHDRSSVIYEHRIINAWDKDSREILGRIANRKNMLVAPFGKSAFLEWKFDVFTSPRQGESLFLELESDLDKCHAIDDLKNTIEHKKKDGFGKAQAKIRGITDILAKTNPEREREKFDKFESDLFHAQREATKIGSYLQANHLLECKVSQSGENILVPYKELYPIIIFGKKFLIAYKDYIIAETHTDNMGKTIIEPLADRLIVKPITKEAISELLIPDTAKEKPQKGEVIAVGVGRDDKPLRAKVGDVVLYRKGAGVSLPGDEGFLMMKEGIDTIGIVHILAD